MTNDPLMRYQSMMHEAKAPDHLADKVLEQVRSQTGAYGKSPAKEGDGASHRENLNPPSAAPTFSAKRTRVAGFAIAACAVLALGVGALALSPIIGSPSGEQEANTSVTVPGNHFSLLAFADEGAEPANGPVTLSFDNFKPSRTSSGYRYDGSSGSYENVIDASRNYNLDLTCEGTNVTQITYEIVGDGVSFNNIEISNVKDQEGNPSSVHANQSSSFTVDYTDQTLSENTTYSTHRELSLAYELSDAEKSIWDESYLSTSHDRIPSDGSDVSEAERAAWAESANRVEAALGKRDASILSQAQIVLHATFADGTTGTKAYRLAPVANFEQVYADYLATRFAVASSQEPSHPALYTIEEIA